MTPALYRSITRNALGLGLFAMVTAGVITITHALTEERITAQVARAEAGALTEIIPEHLHSNDLLESTLIVGPTDKLGLAAPAKAYLARQDRAISGIILPVVAENGYSGDIRMLVGLDTAGNLRGVRVTQHRETPGLGDKIETAKSDWIHQFDGKSLETVPAGQWAVAKDDGRFDQFTGATITPRAVVGAVHQALIYFKNNRQALLDDDRDSRIDDGASSS